MLRQQEIFALLFEFCENKKSFNTCPPTIVANSCPLRVNVMHLLPYFAVNKVFNYKK